MIPPTPVSKAQSLPSAQTTRNTCLHLVPHLQLIRAPRRELRAVDLAGRGAVAGSRHQRRCVDDEGLDGQQHLREAVAGRRRVLHRQGEARVELIHVAEGLEGRVALSLSLSLSETGLPLRDASLHGETLALLCSPFIREW